MWLQEHTRLDFNQLITQLIGAHVPFFGWNKNLQPHSPICNEFDMPALEGRLLQQNSELDFFLGSENITINFNELKMHWYSGS